MQTIRDLSTLYAALAQLRGEGRSVALAPTMGALHAGHLALVAEAARRADAVVVSIFVNPTQFAAHEDLDAYPRQEAEDLAMLAGAGVAIAWLPTVEVMYPAGFATSVEVSGIADSLEGASRPAHFAGVATVVTKLLMQVRPDVALFGEKDYQQLAVIRRVVADLNLGVAIIGVPTERAADGLALSSRNAYLSADERQRAAALPAALHAAAGAVKAGAPIPVALAEARAALGEAGFGPVDYVALCDAESLRPLDSLDRPGRLLAAARIGTTRLIDNIAVNP